MLAHWRLVRIRGCCSDENYSYCLRDSSAKSRRSFSFMWEIHSRLNVNDVSQEVNEFSNRPAVSAAVVTSRGKGRTWLR